MKTSEMLHSNKTAIMRGVTDAMARHGNGFDARISCYSASVYVEIMDFSGGALKRKEDFNVSPQAGDYQVCYDLALSKSYKALRALGVEFITIAEALRESAANAA